MAERYTVRELALAVGGPRARFAYDCFDHINAAYFGGSLRDPFFIWKLTDYSGCLGYTEAGPGPEVIALHPTLLGITSRKNADATTAWHCPRHHLGPAFAYDTILHECVHLAIRQEHGGWRGKGESSHNNDYWVEWVNKLSPMVGLQLTAARNRVQRVPNPDYDPDDPDSGPRTVVCRVNAGTVAFKAVARWPRACRYELEAPRWPRWYEDGHLPFAYTDPYGHAAEAASDTGSGA